MSKQKFRIMCRLAVGAFFLVPIVTMAEEEGIVKDPNGDYVMTYRSYNGEAVRVSWTPSNKIDPSIKWNIKISDSKPGVLAYRYKFKNSKNSLQYLEGGNLIASSAISNSETVPAGWFGKITPDSGNSSGFIVGWFFRDGKGIKPGSTESGFGYDSYDLPGVGIIKLAGAASGGPNFPDEGPSEMSPIREQYFAIRDREDHVRRFIAVPKIPVGKPYDGAAILDALRTHITKDIVELKLIEPIFASQLDRSLQSAADAIRRNSIKAAREHLHDAMKLLKKDHPDCDKEDDGKDDDDDKNTRGKTGSVDRLAARVIAFDIRYVEKRLKNK